MGSLQQDNEGAAQRERISRSSKVPSHWLGPRMNSVSPTILRTRHKFGDYLSQPDLAKFELPKKMTRPWIVNNAFEQEKLKDLIVTDTPVEASLVMRQIKESKQERKKQPGYNKKHVRNINDIIEKDQKTVKESKKKQPTKEHVEKKRKHMLKKQVGLAAPVHKMTQQQLCPTTWLPTQTTWRETRRIHHLLLSLSSRFGRRLCRRVGLGE